MIVWSQQRWERVGGWVKFLSDLANDAKKVPRHHFGFSIITNCNWSSFGTHVRKTTLQKIFTALSNSYKKKRNIPLPFVEKNTLKIDFIFKSQVAWKLCQEVSKKCLLLQNALESAVIVRNNEIRNDIFCVSPGW